MPYSDFSRISGLSVHRDVPLFRCTSFRIGGPARCLLVPRNLKALEDVLDYMERRRISFHILGQGTNLLVSDKGVDVVLSLMGLNNMGFRRYRASDSGKVTADAGVKMRALLAWSVRSGLSGLEDLAGIPGSVGGAVRMNAGTRRGAIHRILSEVRLTGPGGSTWLPASSLRMGYRHTELPKGVLVSGAKLLLSPRPREEIMGQMKAALSARARSQPVGMPSAGCVFKNPEGDSAGRLIDRCGLKGKAMGGAQVSRKHANFIVNTGGARAVDVAGLMALIRETIMQAAGIDLRPEIVIWGEDVQKICR